MIALIQRVSAARVDIGGETVAAIGPGILALVAVQRGDGPAEIECTCDRLLGYRVFADAEGRMNRSLAEVGGGLLLVPQFTLAADTRKGMRAGFSGAAAPGDGERGFDALVERARQRHPAVETGRFGTHMEVHLVNDGPVTFWLETRAAGQCQGLP